MMNLTTVLALLLGFSAICYFLLGLRLTAGKREVGTLPLGAAFLVISFWVLGGAIETIADTELMFLIGRVTHFIGTAIVPVATLLCFRELVGCATSRRLTIALMIVPVLSIAVAATNSWHEYMWLWPIVNEAGAFLTRPDHFGPWFWLVHAPYGYALIGTSAFTLVMHSSAVASSQRRGLFLLAAAASVPVLAVAAYDSGVGPNTVSTVPVVLALMLPIYAWLILGEKVIEFTPMAYETVFQNMQDPVIVIDDDEQIIGMNQRAEMLLRLDETQALKVRLDDVFGDDAMEVHMALDTGEPQKMLTNSGRFLHVQVTPIETNNAAKKNASVLMFRDVSDVERAQREVQNSEKLLRTLIDHSVNGVIRLRWLIDDQPGATKELRCIFANAAAGRYLKTPAEDMIDRPVEELLKLATTGMEADAADELVSNFSFAAESGDIVDTESQVSSDGDEMWLRIIGEPVGEDVALTLVDITDRKEKEEQMESIARSDELTGILNRRGFERDAAQRLTESDDNARGALLFIDLNDFKQINDQYGHDVGDQLLTIAAKRLQKSLRSCDIIGRPGGDEFVALVTDVNPDVAEMLATRLTKTLENSYLIGTRELTCAASIGLALYPETANTLTGLLRAADAAMYRAKARSRDVTSIGNNGLLEKAI
jgi:diguanylate cyclase (GGDEF)-like protein/PAS domain S-box-containing protein